MKKNTVHYKLLEEMRDDSTRIICNGSYY